MFMKWIDIFISITNSIRINYIYGLTAANYQTTELLGIRINTKKANAENLHLPKRLYFLVVTFTLITQSLMTMLCA
jgi:hypothetical protein